MTVLSFRQSASKRLSITKSKKTLLWVFARYYQNRGFTIGELSETAQEAINAPTKKDVASFSFRGSHQKQNLGCFRRNWAFGDPVTMQYAE